MLADSYRSTRPLDHGRCQAPITQSELNFRRPYSGAVDARPRQKAGMTMSNTPVRHVPHFFVKQHYAALVNRYSLFEAQADGSEGRLLAVAQQKRLAVREKVTFYEDEERSRPLFTFRARQVLDVAAAYDVTAADGSVIGTFEKEFRASLLRSSFGLTAPGLDAHGQERNSVVALVRRIPLGDLLGIDLPLPVHFDFVDRATGAPVLSSERAISLRDRYTVKVPDARLDFRLAAAVAVGLDALLAR